MTVMIAIQMLFGAFGALVAAQTLSSTTVAETTEPNEKSQVGSKAVLDERRNTHWAYQPIRPAPVPATKNSDWCRSPIDAFILAKLEENGFTPAPPADRRTLIRRATFDLIGLPPTAEEVDEFLRDSAPDAFAQVVDRLLASPHYGERWARHWLDLVRFSETLGFEFDFDLYNIWRYRDYVIRAFNTDLPYDRFIIEHLAGDLVPDPRRDPVEHLNESIVATGFFWMGEGRQTPVDIRQEQADVIDGQIDVLGKAILGQTIACARCHDHKFDAISTEDYYALAGFLKSSRYQQAFIDPEERIAGKARTLQSVKQKLRKTIANTVALSWIEQARQTSRYLLAAQRVIKSEQSTNPIIRAVALELNLDEARLTKWVNALQPALLNDTHHPLYAWFQMAGRNGLQRENGETDGVRGSVHSEGKQREALLTALRAQQDDVTRTTASLKLFEDFQHPGFEQWHVTGAAFDSRTAFYDDFIVGHRADKPIDRFVSRGAHSGRLSKRLQGELRSQTFTIEKPYIHYNIAGQHARLNLIIDGYTLLMNPMYGGLTAAATNEQPAWKTMAVDRWIGHRAHVEISDSTIPIHRLNPPPSTGRVPEGNSDGWISVTQIYFSGERTPPAAAPNRMNLQALERARVGTAAGLAAAYQDMIVEELERWRAGKSERNSDDGVALLNWLLQNDLLAVRSHIGDKSETNSNSPKSGLAALLDEYHQTESNIPSPTRAPALADGTGEDEFVFLRGDYKTPGEPAMRRPPEFVPGSEPCASSTGSGRLELARRVVDPSNPLVSRVMVNRLWKHHFENGLARTPDDLGALGEPPTHPELLDYLAAEFVQHGWSIKEMHKLMMLSSTYQTSSESIPAQAQDDPDNRLLHHMPVRRLEAEAIRDSMLAVSGRLNPTMYGPSVLPYLTPYMEGRGRPNSGPLDGHGRRSIYINARRNFLTPMLVAFDYPVNFSTVGRRVVSTVPDQALTLMNDPFVVQHAEHWAKRVLANDDVTTEQRVDRLYLAAFTRPATDAERRDAMGFLEAQASRYGSQIDDHRPWAGLCHVLFNLKEFIFVN